MAHPKRKISKTRRDKEERITKQRLHKSLLIVLFGLTYTVHPGMKEVVLQRKSLNRQH